MTCGCDCGCTPGADGRATSVATDPPEIELAGPDPRGVDDATIFKALGNEYRLKALDLLRTGEKCACDLLGAIDVSQPNLSHHMKVLCASGIVRARQEGRWTHYAIDERGARHAIERLAAITTVDEAAARGRRRCCDDDACGPGCDAQASPPRATASSHAHADTQHERSSRHATH